MSILDEIKEQQQKTAKMSRKGKFDYFWYYYKIPFIVVVVIVIFSFFLIKDMISANREPVLQAAIVNSELTSVEESFLTELDTYFQIDPKKQVIIMDNSYRLNLESSDQMTVASSQKMIAMVQVKELDFMIAPSDIIDYYTTNTFYADLSAVIPSELFSDLDSRGLIYYSKDEAGNSIPVGIDLTENEKLKRTGLYTLSDPVLAITVNTPNLENILKFLDFLEIK